MCTLAHGKTSAIMHIFQRRLSGYGFCMTDPAIKFLRHVLEVRGWTAADLAKRAGLSHSTINRPLTVKDWPTAISRKTIAAVEVASGIRFNEAFPEESTAIWPP